MTTTADIPGFVVDDSPDRPAYRPRVTFDRNFPAVVKALEILAPEEAEECLRKLRVLAGRSEDDECDAEELLGADLDPAELDEDLAQLLGFYYSKAIRHLNPEIAEYTAGVIKRLEAGDGSDLAAPQ